MSNSDPKKSNPVAKDLTCGLIMPISTIDGCSVEHWLEVKSIFSEAVNSLIDPKFITKLVSEEEDVGVILKRIVQNVYASDIIVCDVSGKNANVMFELGMRLAFDRPTVIVKDDKTDYPFDTSVIEHLIYPRDLRFSRIVNFKAQLADKVQATYKKSLEEGHTTFLKNFGTFTVASLIEKKSSVEEVILERLDELQRQLSIIRKSDSPTLKISKYYKDSHLFPTIASLAKSAIEKDSFVSHVENIISEFNEAKPNKLVATDKQKLISYVLERLSKDGIIVDNDLGSLLVETFAKAS